jgi:hypothetical protein
MRNAKKELLENFPAHTIKCAEIQYDNPHYHDPNREPEEIDVNLFVGYTIEDMENFLAILDGINYDAGYGGQRVFGTIWFNDGTWATRGEYDGSEWWEHHICPIIPEKLREYEEQA